jgi:hypothetical protein
LVQPARRFRSLLGYAFATSLLLTTSHAAAQPTEGARQSEDPAKSADQDTGRTEANPKTGSASEQAPGKAGTAEVPADPTAAPKTGAAETATGAESPKRAMPDYDGRGEPPTTAGDVLLWIPRVIFSPLYFVSEYLIRRPLGWLLTTAERKQWSGAIRDFFYFGPEKKAGVVPTAFLDFGLVPSIGIYAFWDDLLGPGNHLRLHATTGGGDWLQGALADRIPLGKGSSVDLRVDAVKRPDQVHYGMGPTSLGKNRYRYGIDRFQTGPVFESMWWRGSRITTQAGFRYVNFRDDSCCDDPSLAQGIQQGQIAAPPAFDTGYTALYQRGELTVDTREERPNDQTGFRLEAEIEHGSNVRQSHSNWIRWGGTVGGFLDIKNNRTLSLAVTTLFVDPISTGADIPFTEQINLGGSGPMRGYLYGRLKDRSAAIATLKYRWPIWNFLDGAAQVAFGNVFGPQLNDFDWKLLRLSSAIGIETPGAADHTFEFLVGFGTETFDQHLDVTSFRLLFGTNRGF